jgi:hypothetical protein
MHADINEFEWDAGFVPHNEGVLIEHPRRRLKATWDAMPASFDVNIRFLWRRCRPWQQATGNIPEQSSRLYDPAKINSVRKSDHESSGAFPPQYPNFNVDPHEIINEALSIDTGQCKSSIVG